MRSVPWLIWILVPVMALLGACGSSGDDDDDSEDPFGGGGASSTASTGTNSGDKGGNSEAKVPTIKDGNYQTGKVHVEVTGGRKETIDAEGNAYATGEFALFTYANAANSLGVSLTLSAGSADEPGGLIITTKEWGTAGEWGKDCKISADQPDTSVKGEFSCDDIDAVDLGSVKQYQVKIKGTFTAER